MSLIVPLSQAIRNSLRCPVCRSPLASNSDGLQCIDSECHSTFPIVRGVPILLNEHRSLFRTGDLLNDAAQHTQKAVSTAWLQQLIPSISANVRARVNLQHVRHLLEHQGSSARVLVVGGGTIGEGLDVLLSSPGLELVETDVTMGPRISLVCDAHDLPFADATFDGVVAQAVLEHVLDPHRCVSEMHRVLRPNGIVYAETPFIQQVHLGRLDFARFTHLGHRRLFQRFAEIESGAACGPGMALAWSYTYFLLSFSRSTWVRRLIKAFAAFTSFFLKYFDYFLIDKPGAFDAASGYYFIGRRSDTALSDRELITLYQGAM